LVRFGQRIDIQGGMALFDYVSDSLTGYETVTVTPGSNPPLRAGTYFIGVGNFGPGTGIYAVSATVTGAGGPGNGPSVSNLTANLSGEVLTLSGTATDPDGDIAQAQTSLLNGAGGVINQSAQFNVGFTGSPPASFNLQINNIKDFPEAMRVTLVLIDGQGSRSSPVTADFSLADAGGPNIGNAFFNGAKVVIKGTGFVGSTQVELNSVMVATIANESNTKIKAKGALMLANLRPGSNRLRVIVAGRRSNLFVLSGAAVP
ncbi:MAG TPA: hypothetical protein VFV34_19540, partial [Blastocatellia bacterium]|nr:hypothetical protein [Blastocatellia bacterium]